MDTRQRRFRLIGRSIAFGIAALGAITLGLPSQTHADTIIFNDPFFRGVGRLEIANGVDTIFDRRVYVRVDAPPQATEMMLSKRSDFTDTNEWRPIEENFQWILEQDENSKYNRRDTYCLYVRFRDINKAESGSFGDCVKLVVPSGKYTEFEINGGDSYTSSREVTITLSVSKGVERFQISNNKDDVATKPPAFIDANNPTISWTLPPGNGEKTVYVRFLDAKENSRIMEHTIQLLTPGGSNIPPGSIVKGDSSAVYYVGFDGKLHPFINAAVYHSWYPDFSRVRYVGNVQLRTFQVGAPVSIRPGTWLAKFSASPQIYAVEPGYRLRPIRSEAEAFILYGSNWNKRIVEFNDTIRPFYTVRETVAGILREDDRDRDGVKSDVEQLYGSSDTKDDTDGDGLSDYEEVFYWFSNPVLADTDVDGIPDGREVINGFSPTEAKRIDIVPDGTYMYPYGSMIRDRSGKNYYYYNSDGRMLFLGPASGDIFRENRMQAQFLTNPGIAIPVDQETATANLAEQTIIYPTIYEQGTIIPL